MVEEGPRACWMLDELDGKQRRKAFMDGLTQTFTIKEIANACQHYSICTTRRCSAIDAKKDHLAADSVPGGHKNPSLL